MSDTNAFLISDEILWASPTGPSSVASDSQGFLVPDSDILFCSAGNPSNTPSDSSAFILPDSGDILFGIPGVPFISPADSKAFIIDWITIPNLLSDDAFLFDFDSNTVPPFPTDPTMTEIIYPVVPISEVNKVLFKLDSEEWRATQKAAVFRNEDTDTVRFRVNTNYVATFIGDLHSNKLNQFRLSTPGYTPFGSNSEDNYVRVLSHSRPQREDRGLTQTIDVEFLFVAVYP